MTSKKDAALDHADKCRALVEICEENLASALGHAGEIAARADKRIPTNGVWTSQEAVNEAEADVRAARDELDDAHRMAKEAKRKAEVLQ